jgi:WD40 repeat protein
MGKADGNELFSLKVQRGEGLALSANGAILVCQAGMAVRLYEVAADKQMPFTMGRRVEGQYLALNPDGKRIVTRLGPREFVKLWDVETGEEILTLGRLFGMVTSVAFSPDGNKVAATSQFGEVKIWDATPLAKPKDTNR